MDHVDRKISELRSSLDDTRNELDEVDENNYFKRDKILQKITKLTKELQETENLKIQLSRT